MGLRPMLGVRRWWRSGERSGACRSGSELWRGTAAAGRSCGGGRARWCRSRVAVGDASTGGVAVIVRVLEDAVVAMVRRRTGGRQGTEMQTGRAGLGSAVSSSSDKRGGAGGRLPAHGWQLGRARGDGSGLAVAAWAGSRALSGHALANMSPPAADRGRRRRRLNCE